MTNYRVGDRIQYDEQLHGITVLDYLFKKATLRPVDESRPIGERFGDAVVIPLSKLPLK